MVPAGSLARVVEQLDRSGKVFLLASFFIRLIFFIRLSFIGVGKVVKGQQLVARAWLDNDFKARQGN